jgi:hypothetical protein
MAGYNSINTNFNTNFMKSENKVGRPIIKPKRISTTFGMNINLHDLVSLYVVKAKKNDKDYSINDFINDAIIDKLNGDN